MGAVMGSGSNVRSEYFKSKYVQIGALTAMIFKAKSLGVNKGVAFVSVQEASTNIRSLQFAIVEKTFVRNPPLDDSIGEGDPGTNYFGIAMEKLAVMMGTGYRSGHFEGTLRRGESPYRGGLIRQEGDYMVYVGFSGGTEDRDVEIAKFGMEMMFPK